MTKSKINLLGSLFVAGALAAAGCGGGGSGGGTGGKGGSGSGGTTGTGGHATGGTGAGGTDTGGNGAGGNGTGGKTDGGTTDSGAGGAATPDGSVDATPCTTSVGAGNLLLFAFDNGSITGWEHQQSDPADAGLAPTISGTTTDGNTCPGAGVLTAPFTAYGGTGNTEQAQIDYSFYSNGGPKSYVGYSKVHMAVKVVTDNYGEIAGLQPFVGLVSNASPMTYPYIGQYTGGINSNAWRQFTLDLSPNSSADFKIGNLGAQIQLQQTAPGTGPATPGTITVLIDDVWLEAAPAPDAGPDASPDVTPDVAPAVDASPDTTTPVDTGTDATSG